MNRPRLAIVSATLLAQILVGTVLITEPAVAQATTKPTSNGSAKFCDAVKAAQGKIAKSGTNPKTKFQTLATAWDEIEKASPADIKPSATAVKAAFIKASTQSDVDATATVRSVSAHSAKITKYVSANCTAAQGAGGKGGDDHGPGGDHGGPNPAEMAKIRACMTKEGVTIAEGSRPNFNDAKVQAAAKKCGLPMRGKGPRGPQGPLSDAVKACLKAKGVAIPDPSAKPAAGAAKPPVDDQKFHDALEACGGDDH